MFPKFELVPIKTYLTVLAKMRLPAPIPSARMARSLASRTMSAASLATSVALSTEMPTSASWSATASLTPSPRNPTVAPSARCALITRDFCSGVTRANTVVSGSASARFVVELVQLGAGEAAAHRQAEVGADFGGDAVVVAGDQLHLDLERVQARERVGGVGPRRVEEAEEAGELEVVLVVRREVDLAVGGPGGDGDDAVAGGEPAFEHDVRPGRQAAAAGEDGLRCTLDDDDSPAAPVLDQHGCESPLVVEGARGEAAVARHIDGARPRCLPQRAIEWVGADDAAVADRRVVAEQPGPQDLRRFVAVAVERGCEPDPALGQGAGLVGEEDLDVAEVLDRDQPLDDHRPLGQPFRSGGEADCDDCR